MDKKTIDKLNQLNKGFYLKTQEYFNRSRQFYWQGFKKLLPYLSTGKAGLQGSSLQVLDVGCGNGRFGKFLMESGKKIEYTGIDNNQYLLDKAKIFLPDAKLINQDLLEPIKLDQKFDLIGVYGVMHHIPGFDNRLKILEQLKQFLNKNGLLIVNFWQFNNVKRMKKKVVKSHGYENLEKNDYILSWKMGVEALRFCHFTDESELSKIVKGLKMKKMAEFVADGKEKKGNKYLVLQKVKS